MPCFPRICCDCNHRFEYVGSHVDLPRVRCPQCASANIGVNYGEMRTLMRVKAPKEFERGESVMHWHSPDSVADDIAEMGSIGAECIQPDGRVVFKNRKQQRDYVRAKKAMKRRQKMRADDVESKERDEVKRGNMIEVAEPIAGSTAPNRSPRTGPRDPRHLTRRKR